MVNKPINPALARIQQIKSKAGSGSMFDPTDPFINPIIQQAALEVAQERDQPIEVLPPIEEDQDEARVAMRLIAMQADGIGAVAPTQTSKYNNMDGINDKLIHELESMKPKV